ncbi:hypothetical protein [Streptomyces sp. NPDC048002]|uniref:hypothetical protein n=1 Tax=Streptomyces sp. NPDC048002 TaxID=3154344 RepID=UPI0033E450C0
MTHVEHARLAELALGGEASAEHDAALRHIARCVACRQELARITRVVTTASAVSVSDLPTVPPDRIWERIRQELSDAEEASHRPAGEVGPPGPD